MTVEIPKNNPEKEKLIDDNARKFVTEPIDTQFLKDIQATPFTLSVSWLETNKDNEKKVAHKVFQDGRAELLLIRKEIQPDGDRKTLKEPITNRQYDKYVADSLLHLEKERFEFSYEQDGVIFDMKYDVFAGGKLFLLEVDSKNDDKKLAGVERRAFEPKHFLPAELKEVTEDIRYTGYRICELLK